MTALKHLVLLGGGHAQVAVLKALAMKPIQDLRVSLISRDIMTPYSGMLPGYIEGVYSAQDITIDLSHLARAAGVRFIHGTATELDPASKTLTLSGRPPMSYDLLSVNIGSAPDLAAIKGAERYAVAVKPISTLLERIDPILAQSGKGLKKIIIIGGGAAGVEVALSLHHRVQGKVSLHLIQRNERLMPEFPAMAGGFVKGAMRGIKITCGQEVKEITKDGVILPDGEVIKADLTLMVTAGRAPDVIKTSGLALDDNGFIAVHPTLQSISHGDVFASGDVATLTLSPRPKAGVFAVRAGPVLAKNLRQAVFGKTLKHWTPQKDYLALIGVGGGKAVATRGRIASPPSALAWRLKEWIDRRFISRFSDLPMMSTALASPLARVMHDSGHDDSPNMYCLGCGAKAGWSDLHQALKQAEDFLKTQGIDRPYPIDITQDSARVALPSNAKMVQSVDALSALIDDSYMLGRIAALHALSDVVASHATPSFAQAILTLPVATARLQQDEITQILVGAMVALHENGVVLTGGHTTQASDLQVGFAVSGIEKKAKPYVPRDGDSVILTKPLGIGMVMAAHRKGLADGLMRQRAIEIMAQSNKPAGDILDKIGRLPMTDVTGFGLARHALSLLSGLKTSGSIEIDGESLPIIDGVLNLAESGIASSLAPMNRQAAEVIHHGSKKSLPLLYDPQTGGGLLAIVPQGKAALALLLEQNIPAALIGVYKDDGLGQIRLR